MDVMLSRVKHLGFSSCYEAEILRLRLRMTLRYSLVARARKTAVGCGGVALNFEH
jgi:hypothetical protein